MQSQSFIGNSQEMALAFNQIGNGFLRLAKALEPAEKRTVTRELEYVPIEEVEQPKEKPAAKTPRGALKAVPKAAPAIEQSREEISAEILGYRRELLDKEVSDAEPISRKEVEQARTVLIEAEDPLPEFEQRETETSEEIEAERQVLFAELKSLAAEYSVLTEKDANAEWESFVASKEPYDKPRPWIREVIERAKANIAKARANVSPVAIANPQKAPAELPDGRRKMQRKDAEGNDIAVYEGSHMAGRQATHEETIQNLDYWIDYWRTHSTMGQDLATIRQKVMRVVGEFHDWSDLKGLDLSKAIRTLKQWRPDLEKQTAQKGAK